MTVYPPGVRSTQMFILVSEKATMKVVDDFIVEPLLRFKKFHGWSLKGIGVVDREYFVVVSRSIERLTKGFFFGHTGTQ